MMIETKRLILRPWQDRDAEIEVGYWIGVPFRGNGYIPEAGSFITEICL